MRIQNFQNLHPCYAKGRRNVNFGIDLLHRKDMDFLPQSKDLVVLAHPDDESCFFGFVSKWADNPDSPQLVYTTSGQNGKDVRGFVTYQQSYMQKKREEELSFALDELKIKKPPIMLELMDGTTHLRQPKKESFDLLKKVVEKVNPSRVITFDNAGITGHTDHSSIATNMEKLLRLINKKISLYQVGLTEEQSFLMLETKLRLFKFARNTIDEPDLKINIKDVIPRLKNAFKRYVSQFPEDGAERMAEYMNKCPYVFLKHVKY